MSRLDEIRERARLVPGPVGTQVDFRSISIQDREWLLRELVQARELLRKMGDAAVRCLDELRPSWNVVGWPKGSAGDAMCQALDAARAFLASGES